MNLSEVKKSMEKMLSRDPAQGSAVEISSSGTR
jgi:hypothetical protein